MKINNLFTKTEFKVFLTIWIVYIIFMTNFGGNFMADSMLAGTMSIVDDGTFKINDFVSEICKETGCDHVLYKGNYYSGFAPGLSIIALPVYLLFYYPINFLPDNFLGNPKFELKLILLNILSTIFISSLLSALTAVLLYRISEYFKIGEKYRLSGTFIFSFGTLFLLYSTGYYARIIASFFSILSFYYIIKLKNSKIDNKILFLSGFLSSVATSMDYVHILITAVIFFYALYLVKNRKIIYFVFGAIIPLLGILLYHYSLFDNPFLTPEHLRANVGNYEALAKGFGGFLYPTIEKIWLYSFSFERGLFFYNLILIFSFYGLYLGYKRKFKAEMLTCFFAFFLTFLLYSSNVWPWWWDGSFGPRYLLVTIPYLILPLYFALEKLNKVIIWLFTSLSFLINLLGLMFDRTGIWTYPFDVVNPIFNSYISLFLKRGFSNYILNIIDYKIINLPIYLINILFFLELIILMLIIRWIWRKKFLYTTTKF